MSVRLGPFEIEPRFASGGMGEIWQGSHAEQGVPVAVKVMTGPNDGNGFDGLAAHILARLLETGFVLRPRAADSESARYDVEVEARVRRVTLSPTNKVARSQNEPDRKFLPRFRGFNVRYRKASRMIPLR